MRMSGRVIVVAIFLTGFVSAGFVSADEKLEFFEKKIRPVLVQKCYSCHSSKSKSIKGGLVLDSRAGIRRGGDSGAAVVPKNLDDSLLMEAIRYESLEMPPKEKLPDEVIADFAKWIQMGAPDPREGTVVKIQRKIDFKEAKKFWAYQPLKKTIPSVKQKDWVRNDVDRFILSKLEAKGLTPAGDAKREVLVRRVYFDLVGLPPTPAEIDEFVKDKSPDALANLIDRVMESPQFGEHWGRHWLDVVRYGESTGMERNFTYPHAWRYRDYVIAAFNKDKPFDQFVREQIAGDLLKHGSDAEKKEHLVATGMLAMGPKSLNERNREKFAMDIVDEQIDVTSRAFLGLTAACARCHDHKIDAIPTTDYYALAGIFRSTTTLYGTGGGNGNRQAGRLIPLGPQPKAQSNSASGTKAGNAKKKAGKAVAAAPAVNPAVAKQIQTTQQQIRRLVRKKMEKATPAINKQLAQARKRLKNLQRRAKMPNAKKKRGRQNAPKQSGPLAMGVQEANRISDTEVRLRGEAGDRGATVPRGFLTIATHNKTKLPTAESGRRQLADWIVDTQNPLTARVIANRVWQHLFGQGIVRTVNNFGVNGERPSHPELLDYLAQKVIDEGWSIKRYIRFVMLSRAYQMSSEYREEAYQADPNNQLIWRMSVRRLGAESIRDSILAASGKLDLEPRKGSIVATVGDGEAGRNLQARRFATTDTKRSVYLPIVRGMVPELLRIFDFPEPSIIFGRRDETTVPTQALFMMNSTFVLDNSLALAQRLVKESSDEKERVTTAYLLTLGRRPTEAEVKESLDLVKEIRAKSETDAEDEVIWSGLCHALFASAEFRFIQ